jgi:hypothetical protein
MILWLLSIGSVIAAVFATGTSISDSEALIIIGLTLIGGAILLKREIGRRD